MAPALEVRPQGEEWCWLREDSLKELDCRAPQLRESGKKPGSAREARDHCRGGGAWGQGWAYHMSFFLYALIGGRTPPT